LPSFDSIFGRSPTDLLSFVSGLRDNSSNQRYAHENDLLNRQLGEQGRQYNLSNQLAQSQEKNKYHYLDQELGLRDRQQANQDMLARQNSFKNTYDMWNKARPILPWTQSPGWSFTSGFSQNQ
jgi:hypothetical protein